MLNVIVICIVYPIQPAAGIVLIAFGNTVLIGGNLWRTGRIVGYAPDTCVRLMGDSGNPAATVIGNIFRLAVDDIFGYLSYVVRSCFSRRQSGEDYIST